MRLRILIPTGIVADEEVDKVSAEAANGAFTLLPRHVDFVTALVPGLLSFEPNGGGTEVLAVDEGILVKRGAEVFVSVRRAFRGRS
jgi:F-type H+-transporting ATPase subunit epsilon